MKTQAYFEKIHEVIKGEINKANKSLYIAIAWFTDDELFELLVEKANKGIIVELIILDDEINNQSRINYEQLNLKKGKLWQISNNSRQKPLMHNKFCVIDEQTVINGSYNWTRKAKSNHESITVISESPELALDFLEEFKNIKDKYFGKVNEGTILDISKVIIRIETLKNMIILEEIDDVDLQVNKLKKIIKNASGIEEINDISIIIELTEKKRFAEAVASINTFVNKYRQLSVYIDSELFALKLEIKALELNISSLADEKSEIEKLLYEFEIRYNKILGKLVLKLLKLKRDFYQKEMESNPDKSKEFDEANEDYEQFQTGYQASKDKPSFNLDDDEKQELKEKFRNASKMCHPDIVAEEYKEQAEKVFVDLKNAYDQNDLDTVRQIFKNLGNGIFKSFSKTIGEKEKIIVLQRDLIRKRDQFEIEIYALKKDQTYQTLIKIEDWADYFKEMKEKLIKEIEYYERKITGNTTE